VWTSYADKADWIFCLVRTDTSTKHEGISFILFDMKSPRRGSAPDPADLRREPVLRNLLHRCEGAEGQLVGRVNGGWDIAKRLLQFERSSISAGGFGGTGGSGILGPEDYAKQHIGTDEAGRILDGDLRGRITDHRMYAKAFR
jgi:alkylation response protein AidB-like acyl-CoA dehydrogenase